MENLIVKSFLDYPQHIEDFLEDISLKSFSAFNQKVIKALVEMNHKNQPIRLETIKLKIGEKDFESKEFQAILQADSYPDYLNLKSDFKTYLCFQMQEHLANKLKEATRKSEVFDYEFLDKYISLGIKRNGRYFWEWEEFFNNKPPIEKIETGINFLDTVTDGGIEVGQIVLLSGDPEAGKTLLGVQCLTQAQQKYKVTYFGFEFSVRKHIETLKEKKFKIKGDHYFIDDQSCELNDLIAQIRSLAKEGHKVFLIDSQMKIQAPIVGRTTEEVETAKFTALSEVARNLQVLIIFIIQNSKSDSYTPTGSRKGGHEAHLMIRIERLKRHELPNIKDFYERAKHRRIVILKNKQTGLSGLCYFKNVDYRFFEVDYSAFTSQEYDKHDMVDLL
ncbi:RAD55 family ATPase [Helicobacter pylori]|uniref:RAD55 family ATPase n=1 Tax=Helicobacter pylori TaxID=210 RepID=UPI0005731C3E|nr:ATPase domain-containing protein [Helicobacter pylori]ANT42568.1 replicative DNA helicase [Helicobacter phage Pt1846U]KHL83685.1 helicase DnaB [Helicobacter pylori]MCQ2823342.1 helicase DnaB [Helicobacter pylori]